MAVYLLLIFVGVCLGVCGVLSALLGFGLVYPPVKKPPGETPRKVSLDFESVSLSAHDGKNLAGWWLAPEDRPQADTARPPVVLLHGYTDCKSTYLAHIQFVVDHGHSCLIYDHRGHGESDPAPCSLGPLEALDAGSALDWLNERGHPRAILWGISMGAATAYLAARDDPRVVGVIAESSFSSLPSAIRDTLSQRYRLPFWPVGPLGLLIASWLTRSHLLGVDIVAAARRLGQRPLLVVSGATDPRMPPAIGQRLAGEVTGSRHLVVAGAAHADCWPMGKAEYKAHARWLLDLASHG